MGGVCGEQEDEEGEEMRRWRPTASRHRGQTDYATSATLSQGAGKTFTGLQDL